MSSGVTFPAGADLSPPDSEVLKEAIVSSARKSFISLPSSSISLPSDFFPSKTMFFFLSIL